jgi:uncharacterized protein (TIGR02444 family)
MAIDIPEDGSAFWRFSLRLYRQPGVAPACLTLQDDQGVDVNVMLFGLWLASQGRRLGPDDFVAIEEACGEWRKEFVIPLRRARRNLREVPAGFDQKAADALRTRVKGVELEAERLQQEALFALKDASAWGETTDGQDDAARSNLDAYAESLGAEFEEHAREAVLTGFRSAA